MRVRRRNPDVRVSAVTLLRSGRRMAIVVRVRNLAERTLTDLPVSVGVTAPHGLRRYLNDRAGIDYFDAHLSAIAPRAELTWVFTLSATVPARARPFADVGIPTPGFSSATRLPQITRGAATGVRRAAHPPADDSQRLRGSSVPAAGLRDGQRSAGLSRRGRGHDRPSRDRGEHELADGAARQRDQGDTGARGAADDLRIGGRRWKSAISSRPK